jgi:RNA polymerase sigma factor (sigma-70 family)
VTAPRGGGISEGRLLESFVTRRDEAALEILVKRHGPLVLGLCRRLLRDPNDIEDAFHATFLVLVRRARGLRRCAALGDWLYGVAYRVAARARAAAPRGAGEQAEGRDGDAADDSIQPMLHDELQRLPADDRAPIVLCYLEGMTLEEAAEQLGWSVETVEKRLARAGGLLRARLARRGLVLPEKALAAYLTPTTPAAIPPLLVDPTIKAAVLFAAGKTAVAGLISPQTADLAEGVLRSLLLTRLKSAAVLVLSSATILACAVVLLIPWLGNSTGSEVPPQRSHSTHRPKPLDSGARARVGHRPATPPSEPRVAAGGTIPRPLAAQAAAQRAPSEPNVEAAAHAEGMIAAVREILRDLDQQPAYLAGFDLDPIHLWSRRELEIRLRLGGGRSALGAAAEAHLGRMKALAEKMRRNTVPGRPTPLEIAKIRFYVMEAEDLAAAARAGTDQAPSSSPAPAGGDPGRIAATSPSINIGPAGGAMADPRRFGRTIPPRDSSARPSGRISGETTTRTKAVLNKLDQPVALAFPQATPLKTILKQIETLTRGPGDPGIAIFVDPAALREAKQTMQSPVRINVDGVPLRAALRVLLNQLGLAYCVRDGLLIISSPASIRAEIEQGGLE